MSIKNAISPTRKENYPQWYQQVISAADLAETSPVRGCMVIKPWGYAIWELIQQDLDKRIKETGHVNAYFPLLIPLSFLEKEAQHVEGFAKECAVVTHHRLKEENGKLVPDGKLEEPFVIRPTSETLIGEMYSKWVQSYRDLPIMINQWANVMRWEMRTRLFLRTSEFLWQEGHTAHASKQEALDETLSMLQVYHDFAKDFLAIPVIMGRKPITERFPGAEDTYTIEALMQDGKALQAGTSHFMGQNFAKASNINFLTQDGERAFAWTTSWGVTTRLIGALIMSHSDDDGLVLPPTVAPYHIVILPIFRNEEEQQEVKAYCEELKKQLSNELFAHQKLRVHIDKRDLRGGEKNWQWVKKGIPLRIEIGPRDIAQNKLVIMRRDKSVTEKISMEFSLLVKEASKLLHEIQLALLNKMEKHYADHQKNITSLAEFEEFFRQDDDERVYAPGFARCFVADTMEIAAILKKYRVTQRCILLAEREYGPCIFTGAPQSPTMLLARSY